MTLLSALDIVTPLSLTLSILIITYVTSFCFTAPILNPDILNERNRNSFANKLLFYYSCSIVLLLISIYHALLCFTYPTPPSILCPNPSNLSTQIFTWDIHTILCIVLILISGQILLLSFTQLGPKSNFQISVPKKLVTSGIYSLLQHPSYAVTFVIFLANGALFQRHDGVVACWLHKSIVGGVKFAMVFQIGYLLTIVIGFWVLAIRVRDEEALLKTTFGTEWKEYHRRTKTFIPGSI